MTETPEIVFKTGWKPNTEDSSDGPAHKLFAASPYLLDQPDFRVLARDPNFNGFLLNQGEAGSCWAFATSANLQIYYAVRGIKMPQVSERFTYYNGRNEEYAGQPPVTSRLSDGTLVAGRLLDDSGTEPRLGLRAIEGLGFCSLADCPYSDDPKIIQAQPPDSAYEAAYSQKGMLWGSVSQTGNARATTAADLMLRGYPPQFGMQVDRAFMRWNPSKGPITRIDENDIKGGHMLAVVFVDFANRWVWFTNSWSEWGTPEGFGYMTFDLFGSSIVGDVSVAKFAPQLVKVNT